MVNIESVFLRSKDCVCDGKIVIKYRKNAGNVSNKVIYWYLR